MDVHEWQDILDQTVELEQAKLKSRHVGKKVTAKVVLKSETSEASTHRLHESH